METKTTLKRSLGLTSITLYGVGAILGAGIYVLIGEVAGAAGYLAPLSFLVAAIVVVFSAFSYAELSARYPRSAGEAVYVDEAFSNWYLTQTIGVMVIFTGIVSAATMASGIVGYLQFYLDLPSAIIISLFVIIIGGISCWGIKQASWIVIGITLLEISGLLFITLISVEDMMAFPVLEKMQSSLTDSGALVGLFLGGFLAFYAFIGFEDMVNVAEEINQPEKVLPRAILLAMIISTVLYMLVIFAAVSVLPPDSLSASKAPMADVAVSKGYSAAAISLISIIAVINGAIVQLIMASRVVYGMAVSHLFPSGLARVNAYTSTPVRASIVCIAITLILALLFPLGILAQATSFIVLSIFALVNLALIRINRQSTTTGTVHYPGWIPYVGALLCLFVLLVKVGLLLPI